MVAAAAAAPQVAFIGLGVMGYPMAGHLARAGYRVCVFNRSADKGVAEIIIGKQRNGPIGTCRLTFIGEHTRFENMAARGYDYGQ